MWSQIKIFNLIPNKDFCIDKNKTSGIQIWKFSSHYCIWKIDSDL